LLALTVSAAEDKKVDPTGTWKWSFTSPNGNTMSQTLKLKMEGEKLTGTVTGRNNQETAIEAAKMTADELTFQVTRDRNGEKIVSKYKGKVTADTIKGTIESNWGGENRSREWEAKKEVKKD
jgi:hypothetical protein